MATDFRYAAQTDLEMYYPNFSSYDAKRQIFGWDTTGTTNLYLARNSGLVTQLFANGEDLGDAEANSGVLNVTGEWYYDSNLDTVYYFNSTLKAQDMLIEGGIDNATYFNQMLVNASMELNNLLDARFPMPLPKYDQYDANTAHIDVSVEYDAIVIKMTCYICVANILRSEFKMEEADYYHGLVTNAERTGMVDRLNAGEFKLAFEVDSTDSQGKVRNLTNDGSMRLVETAGEWGGEPYDVCRLICTTQGAYGTAEVRADTYGNDALFGTSTDNIKVTGSLQHVVNGLYVRFQGATMNAGDGWEITVTNENRKRSNPMTSGIELTRGSSGV